MIETVASPRDAVPSHQSLPPRILEVESGWNAELATPVIRVHVEDFPAVSAPLADRIPLAPAQEDFGPTLAIPSDPIFKAYRISSEANVPGGTLAAVAASERRLRVNMLVNSLGGIIRIGTTFLTKILQEKVISPGVVEIMVLDPFPSAFASGTQVTTLVGSDISAFVTLDNPANSEYRLHRASAGIGVGEAVDLLLVFRESGVVPGPWSVYLMPTLPTDKYLTRAVLPAGTLQYTAEGQAGVPLLEILLPSGSPPETWHGADIGIGVAMFRSLGATETTPEAAESPITWIPITTLVAPPDLAVQMVGPDFVQLGIEHSVGARMVGASVVRFPGSGTLVADGEDLNKSLITGGIFTDGQSDPIRRMPAPSADDGLPYPQPGDVLSYVGIANAETPWPVSALRKVGRRDISPVPYTIFPNVGQQQEVPVTSEFIEV